MVAIALNPSAVEFTPCAPPGLSKVDMIPPPPGLSAPPGFAAPPGLCCPPPGLQRINLADHLDESKPLAAPPGKFSPPGNFAPVNPPGLLAGPPGFFVPVGPPGILLAKDVDEISTGEISTDADSDSEASLNDSCFD